MKVYVYIVFHVFKDGRHEICNVFAKPEEAKKHCSEHPRVDGVDYFAVARVPICGFPWLLFLALIALVGLVGHVL